jgi:peptide/nickel transport system substrate-binding protein
VKAERIRIIALAALTVVTVSACASSSSDNQKALTNGSITIRLQGDWDNFDPTSTIQIPSGFVTNLTYDRLLARDAKGNLIPYLARSWTASPTSIMFTVRTDVTCADGTKVTPTVIANSLSRMFQKYPLHIRYFGPGPYTVTPDDSKSTVTVTLGTPFGDAISGFANTGILCPAGIADPTRLNTQSFGSGEYTASSAVHGQSVTLKRRPDWKWGAWGFTGTTPGIPDTINLQVVANDTTAANLFLTGGLDLGIIQGPDVTRLKNEKSIGYQAAHNLGPWELLMNEAPNHVTDDQVVRQAISMSVNQKDFMQAAYSGLGQPGTSILLPGTPCYDPNAGKLIPTTDLAKAKQLLLANGFTAGTDGKLEKNGQHVKISLLGGVNHGNGPDYVLAQLTSLGFDVSMRKLDVPTWLIGLQKSDFDVVTVHASPNTLATSIGTISGPSFPAGSNWASIQDPTVNAEAPQALASVGAQSCPHWVALQEAYLKGYHFVPLGAPDYYYFNKNLDFVIPGGTTTPDFTSIKRKA